MSRNRVMIVALILAGIMLARDESASDGWVRVPLIGDETLSVALVVRENATPADETFLGLELHNHTATGLNTGNLTYYRINGKSGLLSARAFGRYRLGLQGNS